MPTPSLVAGEEGLHATGEGLPATGEGLSSAPLDNRVNVSSLSICMMPRFISRVFCLMYLACRCSRVFPLFLEDKVKCWFGNQSGLRVS